MSQAGSNVPNAQWRSLMKSILLILFLLLPSLPVAAASIAGHWIPSGGDAIVEILPGDTARLILIRTLDPDLRDTENPDKAHRDRRLAGIELGRGFRRSGDMWKGGEIYDPGSGKTYKAQIELIDDNHLQLRGYIGAPMFGRNEVWTRRELFRSRMARMLDMECAR